MNCPYCGHQDSKVIDSRDANDGIRRRRECLSCSQRFTTHEHLQPANFFVLKKDERREEFNPDKILNGIRKACEKRPLPTGAIEKLVEDIEAELYQTGKGEITSTAIGDMVVESLKNLDNIAYIRFASVYRPFTDITALKREIDTLLNTEAGPAQAVSQLPLLLDEPQARLMRSHGRKRR
jgi:transcriptional repressor NrdR